MSDKPQHNKNEPVVDNKHNLPYATRTLDPPIRLVDRAREIEQAHASIQSHVHGKLDVIAKQIRALQEQAKQIITEAEIDAELHNVKCNFEKAVGQTYYLYTRPNGTKYFSMLSPADWNGTPPHKYGGSYRLRADQSFERVDPENSP